MRLVCFIWIALLCMLSGRSVYGCQICVPIPTTSLADRLLEADAVVLAREDPELPFSLRVTEVLKGEVENERLDLFLDSKTRRVLALFPDRHVVCVRSGDVVDPQWLRVGVSNGEVDPLVRSIIAHQADWRMAPQKRARFFVRYLGHPDSQISSLAHLEIGRAPYAEIKAIGAALPMEEVRAFLDDFRMIEWHALYILLLGQSEEERDWQRIEKAVDSADQFGLTIQLSAWATALIEIKGELAIELLMARYLANPERSLAEVQAVLLALSVQGNASDAWLKEQIAEAYRTALEVRPVLAGAVLDDLTRWEYWGLGDTIGDILLDPPPEMSRSTQLRLHDYVQQSESGQLALAAGEDSMAGPNRDLWLLIGFGALLATPLVLTLLSQSRRRAR